MERTPLQRAALLLLLLSFTFSPQYAFAGLVFINEFHYDNSGSDVNEKIELAAPINTNTDNLLLRLYNGDKNEKYHEISLLGQNFININNGFGFLVIDFSSIQNGAADGIALFDNNILQQFLSYEGTLTITDDLLDNVASIDIGVSENGATLASQSLQLVGTGNRYQDFTWQANVSNTFGEVNNQQLFTRVNEPNLFLFICTVSVILLWRNRHKNIIAKTPFVLN
ncbi:MAG: hypothetical protein ACSHW0_01590 [Thalassotalea sp.]